MLKLIPTIFVLYLLTGCFHEDENGQSINNGSHNTIPSDGLKKDYTLRTACFKYKWDYNIEPTGFLKNFSDQPEHMIVDIVDDGGVTINNFFQRSGFSLSYLTNSLNVNAYEPFNALKYPRVTENDKLKERVLLENSDNNIIISCEYLSVDKSSKQTFKSIVPLDGDRWLATQSYYNQNRVVNDLILETSVLSDLRYKIYLKNYKTNKNKKLSLDRADEFLSKSFKGAEFKEIKMSKNLNYVMLSSFGSTQMSNYTIDLLRKYRSRL